MIIIESKGIEEIKQEIEGLSKYNLLFEELEQSPFFNLEISMHINNHDFLQSRILISEIVEKREIIDRISNLSLNIESLNRSSLENNNEKIKEKISLVLNNEYSSIKTIISELSSLKSKIDEFEKLHNGLLNSNLLSLDIKMLLEQDLRKKQKLGELFDKQKGILMDLSKTFVKLAKGAIVKNKGK
ncbi:hypothetical protein HYW19_00400 [Candidatus Woesearchaeota archaeon]|nr:hypothetical protein [Candidatus Woesearchaeota archaeon]